MELRNPSVIDQSLNTWYSSCMVVLPHDIPLVHATLVTIEASLLAGCVMRGETGWQQLCGVLVTPITIGTDTGRQTQKESVPFLCQLQKFKTRICQNTPENFVQFLTTNVS